MTKRRYDAAAQTKPETPIARHEINTPFVIRLLLLLLRFPSFVFVASFWCFAVSSSSSLSLSLLLSSLPPPDRRRLALLSAAFSLVSTLLGNGNEDDDVLFFSKVDDFFDGGGFGVLGYFPRRVSSRAGPLSVVFVVVFFFFFSEDDEDKKVGREEGSKVEVVDVFVVVLSKMMRRLMCVE